MFKRKDWFVGLALLAVIVVIFIFSFAMAPQPSEGDESFVGTDSIVTEVLEEHGVEPWFNPIWEPGSGEIESGLFAIQAALGAGIVGFVLGNFRGRAVKAKELEEAPQPEAAPAGDE
ncbi:energy-coupling factor ABC transporter substrate-binding protein [Tessaracoccus lacteus]|uniref:Cobalt transport protein CbiN n=1 Tax=Tessaracoccus lacteus TaxID=3041766 RepID=A0ABY8PUR0_9ACTN|nr:energy-coupling factor ABC transporter substrate-binding protein [Tessaracoccus sp. T21]WGT46168.1 energy-coupling factor ABC transporter substrate-binding protein [Tessaracoccus sp. T21]